MRASASIPLAALLLTACPAAAGSALNPGAYEVTVRLELPHIDAREGRRVRVCLPGVAADAAGALPVLSENNPLARCPAGKLRRDGETLGYEIVCDGINAGKAYALYDLAPDRFDGRVAMTMGGKNMTMTEVQSGRRIGDCDPATPNAATRWSDARRFSDRVIPAERSESRDRPPTKALHPDADPGSACGRPG